MSSTLLALTCQSRLDKVRNVEQRSAPPNGGGGPLSGVRVLTVDNFFAGNYGPLLLAMHGAEVVKVEQPDHGDALRDDAPYVEREGRTFSHGELRLLRSKASVALDLRSAAGRHAMERLVAKADVFWTNLRPASTRRLGLDYDAVRRLNPSIVYASITGFGLPLDEEDNESRFPAFDIIIQALAGLMARNADPDGTPRYNGLAIGDQVTSLYAAMGVVLALVQRTATGRGQCVDVSMFDSMVALNEKTISLYAMDGKVPPPRISATNAPFGAYHARDGHIVIGVGGNAVWKRFCAAIDRPDLAEHPDLVTGVKRVENEATLIQPIVDEWLANRTVIEAVSALLDADVPAAPVHDVDRVVASKSARLRHVIAAIGSGPDALPLVHTPIRLSDSAPATPEMPHHLGQDTESILRRWANFTSAEVEELRLSGAIA
jgi:CoA:oxalate CoA-transferase